MLSVVTGLVEFRASITYGSAGTFDFSSAAALAST